KKVLTHKDELIDVFEELKLQKLKIFERKFLEEYCSVMEPLALALDKFQGEKSCFLGIVAPTIIALRLKLIQFTHLLYCKKLAHLFIVSLEKRFTCVFDLEHPKSKAFILASISHPKVKLSWAPVRYLSLYKKLFISECDVLNSIESTTSGANNSEDETDGSDSEFYQILNENTCYEEPTEFPRSVKITRKGVFPYEYIDHPNKLNKTCLPSKQFFYNSLKDEDISDEDYAHAH
ncbi:Uncharacterized protein FWK35_00037307, partial [Aphis craccivora]